MERTPGVDEVHQRLLDRLMTGYYPVGSRLPSCRALARELGSNSSTVDRAIGRLAASGRIRTVPRRGNFVEQTDVRPVGPPEVISARLDEVLLRGRRLGLSSPELEVLCRTALERVDGMRRIAVVECNERDLRLLQDMVQRTTDVEVAPVLLADCEGRRLDEEFDAVAVPIFHLNDVADHVTDMDCVVDLNLVASPEALRRLIAVRDVARLVVVAPSARGVQWMQALVGQYHPGQIDGVDTSSDDLTALADAEVLVVNNAAALPPGSTAQVGQVIAIEWELDGRFAPALRARIEHVISSRAGRPGSDAPTSAEAVTEGMSWD